MTDAPPPLSHTIRVNVRFGHSDLLQIAWHGHYVQWLEDARQSLGTAVGLGYEDLIRERFFIGSPDEVAEDILDAQRRTGINHLIISTHWPGMEHQAAMDSMQLFAEEVMPRVRGA